MFRVFAPSSRNPPAGSVYIFLVSGLRLAGAELDPTHPFRLGRASDLSNTVHEGGVRDYRGTTTRHGRHHRRGDPVVLN